MLSVMEAELVGIPEAEKREYLEAVRRCPEQVDDEHKKACLLKENFDAKLAAVRLVRHWKYKRKLFGPHKCFLPMTLSGAVSDDMVALSDGFVELLPIRDAHGRAVFYFRACRLDLMKYSRESMLRAFWYLIHVAIEDPDTRRRGIVYIFNNRGMCWDKFDPRTYRQLTALLFHYTASMGRAMHCCHPTRHHHVVTPIMKMMFRSRGRKRFKIHSGSDEEVLRSLAEFGLGAEVVPNEMGGTLDPNPIRWLSNRMLLEASNGWEVADMPLVCVDGLDADELEEDDDFDSIFSTMSEEVLFKGVERTEPADPPETIVASSVSSIASLQWYGENNKCKPSDHKSFREGISRGGLLVNTKITEKATHRQREKAKSRSNSSLLFPDTLSIETESSESTNMSPPVSKRTHVKKPPKKSSKFVGDPRMEKAIEAKRNDPCMSLLHALIAGGFDYPARKEAGVPDKEVKDARDGVSLFQRKNQLCRRLRSKKSNASEDPSPLQNAVPLNKASNASRSQKKCTRSAGDPRMDLAVESRVANPRLSLLDALLRGGFVFPNTSEHLHDKEIMDSDDVSLFQRKNQLCRRLRKRSKDDPRMCRAVEAKLENPQMSSVDALLVGGFRFPETDGRLDALCKDIAARAGDPSEFDGVSLFSRKSELEKSVKVTRSRGMTRMGNASGAFAESRTEKQSPRLKEGVAGRPKQVRTQKSSSFENRSNKHTVRTAFVDGCGHDAALNMPREEQMMGSWLWGAEHHSVPRQTFQGF
uniref:CRAL-TRIO domain-containing protein n=1 Tax=Odontella aurita TaxID=265563 RepID=A0A7S4MWC3_9STRA